MAKKAKSDKPRVKSLFEHLKAITSYQDPKYWETLSDGDKKTWSNFMLNRFLSMNPDLLPLVAEIQRYTEILKPKEFYLCYIGLIPPGNYYTKYIKGKTEGKYEKFLIDLVKQDYGCSKHEATDYCEILYSTKEGREHIKYIAEKYGTDKKQITKLKLKLK